MGNSLKHKSEFEKLLINYKPNEDLLAILGKIKLALLVAPAATGRNTIIRELMKLGGYHYIVSDTTRKMRINDGVMETNGVEYWFKDETVALNDLSQGNYLGPAIIHNQQFSGINISEIQKSYADGKVAITDIEIQGSEEISEFKKDSLNIFVMPPSFDEWMRRLDGRGEMENDEKKRRLKSAAHEIEEVICSDNFMYVINDDLDKAVKEIDDYIMDGKKTDTDLMRSHASNILSALYSHPFWHS